MRTVHKSMTLARSPQEDSIAVSLSAAIPNCTCLPATTCFISHSRIRHTHCNSHHRNTLLVKIHELRLVDLPVALRAASCLPLSYPKTANAPTVKTAPRSLACAVVLAIKGLFFSSPPSISPSLCLLAGCFQSHSSTSIVLCGPRSCSSGWGSRLGELNGSSGPSIPRPRLGPSALATCAARCFPVARRKSPRPHSSAVLVSFWLLFLHFWFPSLGAGFAHAGTILTWRYGPRKVFGQNRRRINRYFL